MSELRLIEVTDRDGALLEPAWLAAAESVHRQLRPQMPPDYAAKMKRVFDGGGRMLLAVNGSIARHDAVAGVAIWRAFENTFIGRFLYVDDLVTDEAHRSSGVGKALLDRCAAIARELECRELVLDSGVQRGSAHRFYFREGLIINSYNFSKPLGESTGD